MSDRRSIGPMMSVTAPPPSCCAGLRRALLQGWQQDFPIHPSPFRAMAARSGATPRELLSVCVSLQRSGALQPIRVRWGAAMRRQRWRIAFDASTADPSLAVALAALPGCFRIEHSETCGGIPTIWVELETLDEAALHRQLCRLPQQPSACLRLPPPATPGTTCADTRLAACVEEGLRLCARPYAECAKRLGYSEQRLLADLSAWRRNGQLECLMLNPTPTSAAQTGVLALWQSAEPTATVLTRLNAQQGVDRVLVGPGSPEWPWRLSVVLRATPQLAVEQLRELLDDVGLDTPPDHCMSLRIEKPRHQAMLFYTED